jgi:hypothetical protein
MRPRSKFLMVCFALTLLTFLTPICAPAEYIEITSRSLFLNNDYADWLNFPGGADTSIPSGSTLASSVFSLPLTVANTNGTAMTLEEQGNGWSGNFAPGNGVLWTSFGPNGPLIVDFPVPIFGAGAQIQADWYGQFTGIVTAYDSQGNVLATYSLAGNSTNAADNSAIFLGILDSNAQISRLAFDVSLGDASKDHDLGINQLDFLVCPGAVTTVPIPGAAMLLGSGLLALVMLRKGRG